MMKKFVYTLAAAAMIFGFAACSSDEPQGNSPDGKTSLVSLTAQLPAELGSRDFGNGTTATTLTMLSTNPAPIPSSKSQPTKSTLRV